MTGEELGVVLNLRATLSEYEHFMCELSAMIERGVDVPPCGVAKFPMREKLYAQVRDLVLGEKCMSSPIKPFVGEIPNLLRVGDHVWWSYLDEKRMGEIEWISEDGTAVVVVRDNGERCNVPTIALHYDGK